MSGVGRATDRDVRTSVTAMIAAIERDGGRAVRDLRARFDGVPVERPLFVDRDALEQARDALDPEERALLERVTARIRGFADAQRACLVDLDTAIEGGRAGHTLAAVDRAGCYAPGGRYPLVSSILMTATTARAAGVQDVCVASPSQAPIMLAAAAIAGANSFLACGGAHAIAALALGIEDAPPCDVIAGPGNAWVTEAKRQVAGRVGIDMLAGPSELVVVADASADPAVVAADLLAQAEHDPDARVVLLAMEPGLVEAVQQAARRQLETLATRTVAAASWAHARFLVCADAGEVIDTCDRMAPEHLHLNVTGPLLETLRRGVRHYGALFVGPASAEALGDYGAGPNHVLPTGGTARFSGGLSVLTFLRMRTWLHMQSGGPGSAVVDDSRSLARLEGLAAHEQSAAMRAVGAVGAAPE